MGLNNSSSKIISKQNNTREAHEEYLDKNKIQQSSPVGLTYHYRSFIYKLLPTFGFPPHTKQIDHINPNDKDYQIKSRRVWILIIGNRQDYTPYIVLSTVEQIITTKINLKNWKEKKKVKNLDRVYSFLVSIHLSYFVGSMRHGYFPSPTIPSHHWFSLNPPLETEGYSFPRRLDQTRFVSNYRIRVHYSTILSKIPSYGISPTRCYLLWRLSEDSPKLGLYVSLVVVLMVLG